MTQVESNKRVRWFTAIVLLLLSATIVYGAIPQNTIRQDAGIVMPTVNATSGYFIGTENVTSVLKYPQQDYSYVVWNDTGVIYAKNGTTGTIDYSGASFTTVINNTINSLPNGGEISLLKGTFTIGTALVITQDGITLSGEGPNATIIQLGLNANMIAINANDFTIKDLGLNGRKATYGVDVWSGLLIQSADNVYVNNIQSFDFKGKGIFARAVTNSVFSNSLFYDNGDDGLYLESISGVPSKDVVVSNCVSYGNGRKGFNSGHLINIIYESCIAHNNTEDGWNIEGSALDSYTTINIKLDNCISYNNTQNGYRVQMETKDVTLLNCEGYQNVDNGLTIRGNDDYYMKNTKIIGGSYHSNSGNGISLSYGQQFTLITGTSLYNNDQATTNHDGFGAGFLTNVSYVMLDNIWAYDDQAVPTQDRGVDWGVGDLVGLQITDTNIDGFGNTVALIRATNDLRHFAPPA